ncbi:28470_t:CDS:1, partial [Gigaspora margarita]
MKIEHNIGGSIDSDQIHKVQQKCALLWGSDTPLSVFTYLLLEASKKINESVPNHDLAVKGNDMEAFYFLIR